MTLAWFAMVMGLCGLSLAWQRAAPWWGPSALAIAWVLGVMAALALAILLVASVFKAWRFPQAWREDLAHPVGHVFVATVWVGQRWLRPELTSAMFGSAMTPALLIPLVGIGVVDGGQRCFWVVAVAHFLGFGAGRTVAA